MRTPQQNQVGYDNSSALYRAANLKGDLLIVSGSADDNVHIENTFAFVSKLAELNKLPDMVVYPNKNHHINGRETRFTLYKKVLSFFDNHLKK